MQHLTSEEAPPKRLRPLATSPTAQTTRLGRLVDNTTTRLGAIHIAESYSEGTNENLEHPGIDQAFPARTLCICARLVLLGANRVAHGGKSCSQPAPSVPGVLLGRN